MFELKGYQERHVDGLKTKISEFLKLKSSQLCVLQSPTGSGKTIMMAETIKRLADDRHDGNELAFIWIAVHRLHDQSKENLEKYYENLQSITCSYFEDLQDRQIQDGEVLFFNWHSINQENNIYIRDNENEFNLSKVVENTKEAGRKIILVIDESHHTASGTESKKVIEKIAPDITIEVSATPQIPLSLDHMEKVQLEEVKQEQMIKKLIKINHELDVPKTETNEWILKKALDKRQELKSNYEDAGSVVNPLILIQIPDHRAGTQDMKDEIVNTLAKYEITIGNGKLAIYLSEDKQNLENIAKPDNEVEAMIFKQAVTIGWDCPRASILVLFREWNDYTFSIQTVGRIMRMPEIKHYDSENLDNAYVYTNIEKMKIVEDIVKDYITIYGSQRNNALYDQLDLASIYVKRKHEKTRLTGEFNRIFARVARDRKLMESVDLEPRDLSRDIMINGEIENLDQVQAVEGQVITTTSSAEEIQRVFDAFIRKCSSGFAPVHSSERIKRSLYALFEPVNKDWQDIQKLVLIEKNKVHFLDSINRAKEAYKKEIVEKAEREVEDIPKWNVPKAIDHTKLHEERDYKKCIMSPMYVKMSTKPEAKFMDFIDRKSNAVKWWFKNGESDKKYFAISYVDPEDGLVHPFYVDFIIRMENGRVGLFDTKEGFTAKEAKHKAEALARYIKNSKNLFGGIVILDNNEWMYNDQDEYNYDSRDLSDWRPVILD